MTKDAMLRFACPIQLQEIPAADVALWRRCGFRYPRSGPYGIVCFVDLVITRFIYLSTSEVSLDCSSGAVFDQNGVMLFTGDDSKSYFAALHCALFERGQKGLPWWKLPDAYLASYAPNSDVYDPIALQLRILRKLWRKTNNPGNSLLDEAVNAIKSIFACNSGNSMESVSFDIESYDCERNIRWQETFKVSCEQRGKHLVFRLIDRKAERVDTGSALKSARLIRGPHRDGNQGGRCYRPN